MASASITFILINLFLLVAVALSAPTEKQPIEQQQAASAEKENLVSAADDLKPAASHWGGHYGGWGGHWGGHYGYYPYYSSYWGWPGYGYGYGYWPYGGYGGYGGFGGYGWW